MTTAAIEGVTLVAARRRLKAIHDAVDIIEQGWADDEPFIGADLKVKLGDVLRVPDEIAEQIFSLFEIVWLLKGLAESQALVLAVAESTATEGGEAE